MNSSFDNDTKKSQHTEVSIIPSFPLLGSRIISKIFSGWQVNICIVLLTLLSSCSLDKNFYQSKIYIYQTDTKGLGIPERNAQKTLYKELRKALKEEGFIVLDYPGDPNIILTPIIKLSPDLTDLTLETEAIIRRGKETYKWREQSSTRENSYLIPGYHLLEARAKMIAKDLHAIIQDNRL